MPSVRQLEYLVAIAEHRNFRRAAERCNTTQPTLSEQLKVLEERLGAQLVERARAGAMLTPIGAQVAEVAKRIIKDLDEIRTLSSVGDQTMKGVLRVGIPSTIGPYLLPVVVPTLHKRFPDLKLFVREELPETLPRTLADGGYDMIVSLLPMRGEELHCVDLFREPLYLTVAEDHPLAKKKHVQKSDLSGQDMLTLGPGHQLHDVVVALCEEFGANIRLDYEGTSLDMVREMVLTGLGVTFMPGLYVRRELARDPNFKILQIQGRSIYRNVGLGWRKSSGRTKQFEDIARLIREVVKTQFSDLQALDQPG